MDVDEMGLASQVHFDDFRGRYQLVRFEESFATFREPAATSANGRYGVVRPYGQYV